MPQFGFVLTLACGELCRLKPAFQAGVPPVPMSVGAFDPCCPELTYAA